MFYICERDSEVVLSIYAPLGRHLFSSPPRGAFQTTSIKSTKK